MSGGGGRVSRGRMGQTVVACTHTNEEVKAMGQEVYNTEKNVAEIRKSIFNSQEQYAKVVKEKSGLQLSIKKRQVNFKVCILNVHIFLCIFFHSFLPLPPALCMYLFSQGFCIKFSLVLIIISNGSYKCS